MFQVAFFGPLTQRVNRTFTAIRNARQATELVIIENEPQALTQGSDVPVANIAVVNLVSLVESLWTGDTPCSARLLKPMIQYARQRMGCPIVFLLDAEGHDVLMRRHRKRLRALESDGIYFVSEQAFARPILNHIPAGG